MNAPQIKFRNAKGQIERIHEFMRIHTPDHPDVTIDKYKITQESLDVSYREFNKYHVDVTLLYSESKERSE